MKPRLLARALPGALVFVVLVLTVALRAAETDIGSLRAKAEKGNAVAQYNLGLAYAEGREVPRDFVEAYVWLSLAAETGTTGKALGTLLGEMSADQLTAGKSRLNERRAAIPGVVSAHPLAAARSAAPAVAAAQASPEASAPAADRLATLERELGALRDEKAKWDQDAASMRSLRKSCEDMYGSVWANQESFCRCQALMMVRSGLPQPVLDRLDSKFDIEELDGLARNYPSYGQLRSACYD